MIKLPDMFGDSRAKYSAPSLGGIQKLGLYSTMYRSRQKICMLYLGRWSCESPRVLKATEWHGGSRMMPEMQEKCRSRVSHGAAGKEALEYH